MRSIALDWEQRESFLAALAGRLAEGPPPDLTVAWLHDPDVARPIVSMLRALPSPGELLHVIGSASYAPERTAHSLRAALGGGEAPGYRQVLLGFAPSECGARWLTDEEVSTGLLRSLRNSAPLSIVGAVEPWDQRPERGGGRWPTADRGISTA